MARDKHPTEKVGRNPKLATESTAGGKKHKETKPKKVDNSIVDKLLSYPKAGWTWVKGLNRNTKLALALGLVLVFVGVLSLTLGGESPQQEQASVDTSEINDDVPQLSASISLRQGTLEAKDDQGEWADAPSDLKPEAGSTLRTVGAASRSVIAFEDGSELRLDANSEIEIKTQNVDRIEIKQVNGYSYARVMSGDRKFIVFSDDAHYEAQGTAFKVAVSGDEQAVEVYQSSVHETTSNNKPNEGEKLIVRNKSDSSKDGKIEKLDIEQVKQDQFMIWNRDLDTQNENFKNALGFLNDIEPPEITVSSPADGETVLLDPSVAEGSTTFSGKTERGATLTIQSKSTPGSQPVSVTVDGSGSFTTPVMTAPLGDSVFEFIAKDRTGNKTTLNIRINFQRKSAPINSGVKGIDLDGGYSGGEVSLSWSLQGNLTAPDGYKVVWSPGDGSKTVDDTATTIDSLSSGTYYFRVCNLKSNGSTCDTYSNTVEIEIP